MNFLAILNPKIVTSFSLILAFFFSCNPRTNHIREGKKKHSNSKSIFSLVNPKRNILITKGESFDVTIKSSEKNISPDSTYIYIGGNLIQVEKDSLISFKVSSHIQKVGKQNIRLLIYYSDTLSQNLIGQVTILSDIKPIDLKYKVLRTLPHDNTSYTQGLIVYDKMIYEGTGRENNSKIRKIDPADGKILKEVKMDDEFFGEGITEFDGKIYQLTYHSKVGFIYDINTFEVIRKFDLQTLEGWGLTNDSKNLISSDGSSLLYFYDPEYLSQVGQLEACNDKGVVNNLNELEYVNGFIYANVYGEPYIVKIDARSGCVTAILNLLAIFPEGTPADIDHVLNGIAYNPDSGTFFVTGKLWPVMYEIEVTE